VDAALSLFFPLVISLALNEGDMKRCALTVLGLYALFMLVVVGPLAYLAFLPEANVDVFKIYLFWPMWAALGVTVLAQYLLIRTPVEPLAERPHKRANVIIPIATAGLLAGILVAGIGLCLFFVLFGEDANKLPPTAIGRYILSVLPGSYGMSFNDFCLWGILAFLPLTWLIWGVVFSFVDYRREPKDVLSRQCRLLLAGSLLELLVAVPSHVIVRMRHYCCAGLFTFTAIAFGLAVMLIAFGPALLALFAARWRLLHPER
jgi:hypothetical protein